MAPNETTTTDELRTQLIDEISARSGIDYLDTNVTDSHSQGPTVDIVIVGRDAPTEHTNAGESVAVVGTDDGKDYFVQLAVADDSGWTLLNSPYKTSLTLTEAVCDAEAYVTDDEGL